MVQPCELWGLNQLHIHASRVTAIWRKAPKILRDWEPFEVVEKSRSVVAEAKREA